MSDIELQRLSGPCIIRQMTKFHLHIRDGDRLIEDLNGIELPDLASARREAFAGARELLAARLLDGELVDGQQIEITDDDGRLLANVPFKSAFRLPE